MKFYQSLFLFLVIALNFLIVPSVMAESGADINPGESSSGESSSGSGLSDDFMKGLMGILQESIDDFIGNYKGKLGDVKLLDRRGNKIVLEVTYDNVKRSDNVYVQGEVRYFGEKLDGFKNTLSSISGSRGKARLTIGKTETDDDGWGTTPSEVQSDQIRLFLVRGTNPDRPFGEIIYDLPKLWTDSDEPDQESMAAAEDDSVELAEDEETQDTGTASVSPGPGFVKPGTVLKPHTPVAAAAATGQASTTQQAPQASSQAKPMTVVTPQIQSVVQSYNFYSNAKHAQWRSSSGSLPFQGRMDDPRGFVRQVPKAALSTGNAAMSLLQTHPQWKTNGWIQGHYPPMVLGKDLKFKAVVGFLKGATRSDGVVFQVHIKEGSKYHRAISKRVRVNKYAHLEANLAQWSGKKVQIVLQVIAGNTSDQDWAVWVKPRLDK